MEFRSARDLAYQCCFCKKGIDSSHFDPCDMSILTNVDKAKDAQLDQTFYCHLICFKAILSKKMKEYFVLDTKNRQCDNCGSNPNDLDCSDEPINYICCICNHYIISDDTDPCDINVMINIDKDKKEQYNQTFYCHILCLKNALHKDIQGYLVAALPE